MTTTAACSPAAVVASGMDHDPPRPSTHRSAATSASAPADRITAPAATHPPKNSTWVALAASSTGTDRYTSRDGPSVNARTSLGPPASNVVVRTRTDLGPGLRTAIQPFHPEPPPCGQNQEPLATPAPGGVGGGGLVPARVRRVPERTMR